MSSRTASSVGGASGMSSVGESELLAIVALPHATLAIPHSCRRLWHALAQLPRIDARPNIGSQRFRQRIAEMGNSSTSCALSVSSLPDPVACLDSSLDPYQQDVVALAMGGQDLLLLSAKNGTGRTRVVVEVIRQSIQAGQRVLVVAATPSRLRTIWHFLHNDSQVLPLSVVEPENGSVLPDPLPFCCLDNYQTLAEQHFSSAIRRSLEQQQEKLRQLQQQLHRWNQLLQGWMERERLLRERQVLQDQLANIDALVDDLVDRWSDSSDRCSDSSREEPFLQALSLHQTQTNQHLEQIDAVIADLEQQMRSHREVVEQTTPALEQLRPLVGARQAAKVWSLRFWQGLCQPKVAHRLREVEERRKTAEDRWKDCETQLASLREQRQSLQFQANAQRDRLIHEEKTRRKTAISAQIAQIDEQFGLVKTNFHQAVQELRESPIDSETLQETTIRSECSRIVQEITTIEQALAELGLAQNHLENHATLWNEAILGRVNLVVAVPSALSRDTFFQSKWAKEGFDRVIVMDAEEFSDYDLTLAGQYAERWLLIGEADTVANDSTACPLPRNSPRHVPDRPPLFDRLYQACHRPTWIRENDRFVCRLLHFQEAQRAQLEIEHVTDAPEVELRIATQGSEPRLAEVAFAQSICFADAKRFLHHELNEIPLFPVLQIPRWESTHHQIIAKFSVDSSWDRPQKIELQPGVREWVACRNDSLSDALGWRTVWLEWDRNAGWTESSARDWLRQVWQNRPPGIALTLPICHRGTPALFRWWSWIFDWNELSPSKTDSVSDSWNVDWISVSRAWEESYAIASISPMRSENRRNVGLEIDLADTKHLDRLCPTWRNQLPNKGIVNPTEASTVIRELESWLSESTQASPSNSILVSALSVAQVKLLRWYAEQSTILRHRLGQFEILEPEQCRGREFHTVMISLTRSSTTRAVSLGEHPSWFRLLTTRATHRLILLGDPATIARRARWKGALEGRPARVAERERQWASRLLEWIDQETPTPQSMSQVTRP